ncbi:MAG: ribosome-binding factor [Actinomycetota bacterium]|jgi:ribosome-binding factor A|nr:ribosome-binding factor [Actinomycetota bacterium]
MTQRTERVQKLAKEVLGEAIQSLKDPRVGFTTVTAVRVTRDLRYARVFISVLGSHDEQDATMQGLKSATPFLRGRLGREMRVRYLPELTFELDHGPEEAERLERLLARLHEHQSTDDQDEGET